MSYKNPIIIIRNFYEKKSCQILVDKITNHSQSSFQDGKLLHLGPFLMDHTTDKKKYFEKAQKVKTTYENLFSDIENPITKIYDCLSKIFKNYIISVASEFSNVYSPAIIRIHEKGKSIPIHKDNVRYEGKEYSVSEINHQLSCVLHLQESETGGDLVIYDKKWIKEHEKFRNIDFGYSSNLIGISPSITISDIIPGDLVIINPNYYHEVLKITGSNPRITLGMFLGFHTKESKIVTWA